MTNRVAYEEGELVASLRRKDNQAFAYLYDHYAGALGQIVRQIIPDEEVVSDVLQETFVSIWRKIELYDEAKGRLFTWMLNIARNAAIDKRRSKGYQQGIKQQSIEGELPIQLSVKPGVDDIGIKRLLLKLKDEHRMLIDLSYFQGYTHEQIAKVLDMPLGTVKTRIRTALTQLRALLS